jgi:predicted phage terminase large subunit-like protein
MNAFDRERIDLLLKYNLVAFTRRVLETLAPAEPYQHNWHIEAMAWHLQLVAKGEVTRLAITVPPCHLKSTCVSVAFVAWMLGHNPSLRIICISYSGDLAGKHARDCRRVMESEWYRRIFPKTRLSSDKNTEMDFVTTAQGYRYSTSFGGTLTGRGGNLIIIDDPLKAEDAFSEVIRPRANEFYDRTLYSRLDDKLKDPIILVQQRLHVDDLVGHVMRKEKWTHLNLPAIAKTPQEIPIGRGKVYRREIGELLHPTRESRETLDAIRAALGTFAFSAQYDQEPVPIEGGIVQLKWFGVYDEMPQRRNGDRIVQSWDTALTDGQSSDYSVCITFLVRGMDYYMLDVLRVRVNYPELRRLVYSNWRKWGAGPPIIEDKGSGTSLIQELRGDEFPGFPKAIAFKPEGDKVSRMHHQSPKIEAGHVHLPREAEWRGDFLNEIAQFPNSRYDDQVDSLSQFLNWIGRPKARGLVVREIL